MTFRIYMNTHVIFLDSAFESLKSMTTDADDLKNIRHGMNVVISCAASVESYCNMLLLGQGVGEEWLKKNPSREKIKLLLANSKTDTSEGAVSFETIKELTQTRNWLIHFKYNHMWLVGSDNVWIVDELNDAPEKDPFVILGRESSERFYRETKKILIQIATANGESEYVVERIHNDDFGRGYFTAG